MVSAYFLGDSMSVLCANCSSKLDKGTMTSGNCGAVVGAPRCAGSHIGIFFF